MGIESGHFARSGGRRARESAEQIRHKIEFFGFTDAEKGHIIKVLTALHLPLLNVHRIYKSKFMKRTNGRGLFGGRVVEDENGMYVSGYAPDLQFPPGSIVLSDKYFTNSNYLFTLKEILAHEVAHSISPVMYSVTEPRIIARKQLLYGKGAAAHVGNFSARVADHMKQINAFPSFNMLSYYNQYRAAVHPDERARFIDEMFACLVQNYFQNPEGLMRLMQPADLQELIRIIESMRRMGPNEVVAA